MRFDNVFGMYEQSVMVRAQRASVLANNIANAETPGYKARDIDFREVLGSVDKDAMKVATTNKGHINTFADQMGVSGLKYRNPIQPSIDNNTVDPLTEKAAFADNTMRFQASVHFLNSRIKGLITALKGQ